MRNGLHQILFGLSLAAVPGLAMAQATTTAPSAPMTRTAPTSTPTSTPMGTPMAAPTSTSGSGMSSMSHGGSGGGSVTHYSSQSEAASSCTGDTVVWANPRSKAMHTSESKFFGKSKHGFYACEKTAMSGGYHMAGHGAGKKHKTS